jgi:hypothetical protein
MHPQFSLLLESFWDEKHQAHVIAEERHVSYYDCFYVFY